MLQWIINTHSFIDVITNSSSELFVCDTEKSIETIKEILIDLLNKHGYTFEKCFGEIKVVKDVYEIKSDILGYDYLVPYFYSEEEQNKWFDTHIEEIRKRYLGKIVIYSKGDNSIPYELFDLIESLFFATRIHMG